MMSSRTISKLAGEKSSYLFFYNCTRIYAGVDYSRGQHGLRWASSGRAFEARKGSRSTGTMIRQAWIFDANIIDS